MGDLLCSIGELNKSCTDTQFHDLFRADMEELYLFSGRATSRYLGPGPSLALWIGGDLERARLGILYRINGGLRLARVVTCSTGGLPQWVSQPSQVINRGVNWLRVPSPDSTRDTFLCSVQDQPTSYSLCQDAFTVELLRPDSP